jgi:hypothetical protein
VYRNVGIKNSDAGELPRRKHRRLLPLFVCNLITNGCFLHISPLLCFIFLGMYLEILIQNVHHEILIHYVIYEILIHYVIYEILIHYVKHGSPTRGPPVCIMQSGATFVNCVCTIKFHINLDRGITNCYISTCGPRISPQ